MRWKICKISLFFEPELYKKTAIEENMSDIVMSCIRQVYGAKPPDFTLMHWKQTVRMCQNQRVTMRDRSSVAG